MLKKILPVELYEHVQKFKKLKRAYYSFWILLILFVLSIPSELIFNDVPIAMRVNDAWYFPVFKDYSYKDFGGISDLLVQDYNGEQFQSLHKGIRRIAHPEILFGDGAENVSDSVLLAEARTIQGLWHRPDSERKFYTIQKMKPLSISCVIWPPIPYNYKTTSEHPELERQTYAAPFNWNGPNHTFQWEAGRFGHWLGTDSHGKDVLARIVYGFRISLIFGVALAFSGALVGTFIGAIQGFFGGVVDLFGQRVIEIWAAIPQLFLLMILSKFMSDYFFKLSDFQHYFLLFGILNLTAWMGLASYMRAEFLRARNLEYVKAAHSLGLSNFKIMLRHILPNSLTPIVTFLPFNVSGGLLALVSLDFLGFGVKYPAPSLGELLQQGQEALSAWWIILPTFIILAFTLILLTFIGEGVRHAFDPRAR